MCPSPRDRCRGKTSVSFRRCLLPTAYGGRLILFRCPGYVSVRKVELCPCAMSMWSEWSQWTICPPLEDGKQTRHRFCIRQKDVDCAGASLQEAHCRLRTAPSPTSGQTRLRRVRRKTESIEDIKKEVLEIDWDRSSMARMPRWVMPAAIAGLVGLVFVISCCIVVVRIHHRRKEAQKAKKAKEIAANQDEMPLLGGVNIPEPPMASPKKSSNKMGRAH